MNNDKKDNGEHGSPNALRWVIPLICVIVVLAFVAVLAFSRSRATFCELSNGHPMIMGFIKFALLATVGELLAIRMRQKQWLLPSAVGWRMIIWGIIGAVLAIMLKMYTGGVLFLIDGGFIPGGGYALVRAFATSVVMNITFGPVMMAVHKMADTYHDINHDGVPGKGIKRVVKAMDWEEFVSFVMIKTVPIFWIPAHTITFLLPGEYQTIMAAFLSMALGILLCLKRTPREDKTDKKG